MTSPLVVEVEIHNSWPQGVATTVPGEMQFINFVPYNSNNKYPQSTYNKIRFKKKNNYRSYSLQTLLTTDFCSA